MQSCRSTLRLLTASSCQLGPPGARELLPHVVQHKRIAHLNLDNNDIGAAVGVELFRALVRFVTCTLYLYVILIVVVVVVVLLLRRLASNTLCRCRSAAIV